MNHQYIEVSESDGVAVVTLNRADKSNAMNADMIRELIHVIKHLNHQDNCRLLMIHGRGKHFCAGADIKWMKEIADISYEQNFDDAQLIADLMYHLYIFNKPTIVLAHGATMGGGLGLMVSADIAIASDDAYFAFSEVKIGITPSTISPYVVQAIGIRAAKYYFLTGKRFDAKEAQQLGLVHKVTATERMLDDAKELAKEILKAPEYALVSAKQLVHHVANKEINERLSQKTAEHLANLRSRKEAKASIDAFIKTRLS